MKYFFSKPLPQPLWFALLYLSGIFALGIVSGLLRLTMDLVR